MLGTHEYKACLLPLFEISSQRQHEIYTLINLWKCICPLGGNSTFRDGHVGFLLAARQDSHFIPSVFVRFILSPWCSRPQTFSIILFSRKSKLTFLCLHYHDLSTSSCTWLRSKGQLQCFSVVQLTLGLQIVLRCCFLGKMFHSAALVVIKEFKDD